MMNFQYLTGENCNKALHYFDPETRMKIEQETERRVQETIALEKKAVEERRERLRRLYNNEALQQTHSSDHLDQQSDEKRFVEMKEKIMQIETKRESERLEVVEKKRAQQKFLNCEKIRSVLSEQQEKAVKMDQLWQMNQKLAASIQKSKEDEYFHGLILQNLKDSIKLDEEIAKSRWEKKVNVKQGYLQQIQKKKKAKEEEEEAKGREKLEIQLWLQKNKEAEEQELQAMKKRKNGLAAEMKKLIEREDQVRKQKRMEEKYMAEKIAFIGSGDKQVDKDTLKSELEAYRACLEEMTAKRKAEEKRFDEKLAELTRHRENKQNNEKKMLDVAREELKKSVLQGREHQMRQKNEQEKFEKEMRAIERNKVLRETEQYQLKLEKARMNEIHSKKKYAEELQQQMKERDKLKALQKEEEEKAGKAALAEEVRLQRELENLIISPPGWNKHPLQGTKMATYFIPQN